MHAFILIPILASITAALAHSKGLQSRQPCSSDCSSPSSDNPFPGFPFAVARCLIAAGCHDVKDVCSFTDALKNCVNATAAAEVPADAKNLLSSALQKCPNTNSTAADN
ncbi:hypothetical protein C8Q73DRAFT_785948 [Cubamyces lactineus]|nr:hypothetical protein C8Q73DRAFT_785948 [Cubamyces lactineus]